MRYALIKNGVVQAAIIWDGITEITFDDGVMAVQSDTLNIGDNYE